MDLGNNYLHNNFIEMSLIIEILRRRKKWDHLLKFSSVKLQIFFTKMVSQHKEDGLKWNATKKLRMVPDARSQVARCLLLLYRLRVVEKTLVPKLFHLLSGLMPELFETRELIVQFWNSFLFVFYILSIFQYILLSHLSCD